MPPPSSCVCCSYLKHLSHTIPIDPAVPCAAAPSSSSGGGGGVAKLKTVVKLSRVQQVQPG